MDDLPFCQKIEKNKGERDFNHWHGLWPSGWGFLGLFDWKNYIEATEPLGADIISFNHM